MVLRVCVIGAGPSGLVMLRHLAARPDLFQAVAYERTPVIGGTWVYTDAVGMDEYGVPIHTSMYHNLRTNLPKQTMAYLDFPFDEALPSFMEREEVLKYLQKYTSHFQLQKCIKFNTSVEMVIPHEDNGGNITWEVKVISRALMEDKTETEYFDAVVVCNGHYSEPFIPDIPGLDSFPGVAFHSHSYRRPEPFKGQTVLLLGAGPSGMDIAVDMSSQAKTVLLSHRRPSFEVQMPNNVHQVSGLVQLDGSTAVLQDGDEYQIDALLLCTGYKYDFPFLDKQCAPDVTEKRVTPLYKHCIHTSFPTLSFVGIPKLHCPFATFDHQARFIVATLDGSIVLPSKAEMDKAIQKDFQHRLELGWPKQHAHVLGVLQMDYFRGLASEANFEPMAQSVVDLYLWLEFEHRLPHNLEYRQMHFKVTSPTTYEVVDSGTKTPLLQED